MRKNPAAKFDKSERNVESIKLSTCLSEFSPDKGENEDSERAITPATSWGESEE